MTTTVDAADNTQAAQALAKVETSIAGLDLRSIGTVLVKSGYFADASDISKAIVKVLAGRELGFGPIASMQGVYLVKGRVTLAANLVAAAIQRSGRFRYQVAKLDRTGCVIKFYERWGKTEPWQELGESTFDAQDAADAGLAKGDNYRNFPRNMYFARALTNGARWYTPEVFNGPIYTPDEMGASIDDDGRIIDVPASPPMDTAQVRANATEHTRVFGSDQAGTAFADIPQPRRSMVEHDGRTVDANTGEVLSQPDDTPRGYVPQATAAEQAAEEHVSQAPPGDYWAENRRLTALAAQRGVQGIPTLPSRSGKNVVEDANEILRQRIKDLERDQQLAAEQEGEF